MEDITLFDKVHIKLSDFVLTVICCVIVIFLMGCGAESKIENTENQNAQNIAQTTTTKVQRMISLYFISILQKYLQ